ncbi:bifunctional cystathionine gamma-lyase/homocysteine desulfhydrase [Haloplasma contractile]|uniref:Cystathionine beta-lyase protein n=1 Tax=Haloplasma contractile SSD-17B TaxID=1033810 RepID=F7PVG3_9MOLU|nr:bifunctional cystathionine gamma-lyase/homocysteine desulfhydrase [Haloplasma contractile]ERJ12870.1 cystathionine beta-lyase protein [Haloplasma contractile SSD-17B]
MKFNSLVIHGGIDGDEHTGSVNVPIYQTSTYRQEEVGKHKGYEYSRTGNPTRFALEQLIADLESGYKGFAFGSGMAAISSVLMMFNSSDHIIFSDDVYGGSYRVVSKIFTNLGLEHTFTNTSDIKNIENAIKPNTKAIYIETPTNPLMKLTNIKEVAKVAKNNNLLLIVDNTFMTPYLQKPIELGADLVLHSATKYLGGHSDLVAGLVVVNTEELAERLHFIQNSVGGILGPMDSFLLIRGIKTLSVRMEKHCQNAMKIISWLEQQDFVTHIHYPKFDRNEDAKSQMKHYGGMISFDVKNTDIQNKILSNLHVITLAESLGGIETLISVPSRMTHASIPSETRKQLGITDTLIRLSVGIEDSDDIIRELDITNK